MAIPKQLVMAAVSTVEETGPPYVIYKRECKAKELSKGRIVGTEYKIKKWLI